MFDLLVLLVAFLSLIVGLNALRLQKIAFIESSLTELSRQINSHVKYRIEQGEESLYIGLITGIFVTNCVVAGQQLDINLENDFLFVSESKQKMIDKFYLSIHVQIRTLYRTKKMEKYIKELPISSEKQRLFSQLETTNRFIGESSKKYD